MTVDADQAIRNQMMPDFLKQPPAIIVEDTRPPNNHTIYNYNGRYRNLTRIPGTNDYIEYQYGGKDVNNPNRR